MLDAFEARLIEVLGDGLASVPALSVVARARDGLAAPTGDQVQLRVRLLDARPQAEVGDDERPHFRQGNEWLRRITLRLEGEVELAFRIGPANPAQRPQQRERLVQVVDRALIVLADEGVRSGQAFRAAGDLGFELDGFRMLALEIGAAALPEQAIIARLLGASPGELLGLAEPNAPGWFRFAVASDRANRFVVRYRAPAAVSGKAEARIALAVARSDAARIDLGTMVIEVRE